MSRPCNSCNPNPVLLPFLLAVRASTSKLSPRAELLAPFGTLPRLPVLPPKPLARFGGGSRGECGKEDTRNGPVGAPKLEVEDGNDPVFEEAELADTEDAEEGSRE